MPTGSIPDPMDDWMTRANATLEELSAITASAETLAAGSSATAEITEVNGHKNIAFGIPKGDQGDPGQDGRDGTDGKDGKDGTNGTDGTDGVTFTPSVSSAGVISWTNDGGQENPQSVDLVSAVISALPSAVGVSF